MLLIGDSLGMVVQGQSTTLPVTLEHIIYHTQMVSRGANGPMVIADLPFMTYQISEEEALRSAGRIMSEGGAHGVKLEGGAILGPTVRRLVDSGIPVVAHIGLTPQSVHALGGFSIQGKKADSAKRMIDDALALEAAGACAVVLEMVPAELAKAISDRLTIPTIGIGAGPDCDGQVLVFHDFIGYTSGYIPKHNKRYFNFAEIVREAASQYVSDVQGHRFPEEAQTVRLKPEEQKELAPVLKGEVDDTH